MIFVCLIFFYLSDNFHVQLRKTSLSLEQHLFCVLKLIGQLDILFSQTCVLVGPILQSQFNTMELVPYQIHLYGRSARIVVSLLVLKIDQRFCEM